MIRIQSRSTLVSLAVCRSKGFRQLCSLWFEYDLYLNRKPPSDYNKISHKAGHPCLNRTSWQQVLFWQPLICLRTRTCERLIFLNRNFKPDLRASKLCKRQIYLEPDLRASKLCGRKMSLEPDFKPETLI